MERKNSGKMCVSAFSACHFLMDFMCHYFMFRYIWGVFTSEKTLLLFITYNFCAFALQCPIGYLCDKVSVRISVAVSFLLLGTGYFLGMACFSRAVEYGEAGNCGLIIAVIIIGLANSALHAAGCKGVMIPGEKGLKNGGVFIAFGALGVGVGDFLGMRGESVFTTVGLAVSLLFGAFCLFSELVSKKTVGTEKYEENEEFAFTLMTHGRETSFILVFCLVAVLARSYGGFVLPAGFKALTDPLRGTSAYDFSNAMLSSVLGFTGKFIGGFLVILSVRLFKAKTDIRLANLRYGTAALVLSSVLCGFFGNNMIICSVGILLFHSVMPVTLYEIYCILPENAGFALGLTTLMLFAGTLPAYIFSPSETVKSVIFIVTSMVAAVCLLLCARIHSHRTDMRKIAMKKEQ